MESREEIPPAPPNADFPFAPCFETMLSSEWSYGWGFCNLKEAVPRTPLLELVEKVFAPETDGSD